MLINCTNHPYEIWNEPQREGAKEYGEVVDIPFPEINPKSNSADIRKLVKEYAERIETKNPDAVLVAGEFTFVFMLVDKLLSDGVTVLSSCSSRITKEVMKDDGSNEKQSVFLFERF